MRLGCSRFWFMLMTIGLLLALLVLFVDWPLVWQQVLTAPPLNLIAAWIALLLGQLIFVQRWRNLVGSPLSYKNAFDAANVGQMLNLMVPLRPGEPTRILLLNRLAGLSLAQGTSSVVVERWFELLMRLLALGGAIALGSGMRISDRSILWGVGLLVIVTLVIIWLLGHQEQALAYGVNWLIYLPGVDRIRATKIIQGFFKGMIGFSSPRRLIGGIGISLLAWGCFYACHMLVMQALNPPFSLSQQLSFSLVGLALSPPSAPTQPGLYHASILAPLKLLGYPVGELSAWVVVLHVLQIIVLIPLGLWGAGRSGLSFTQMIRADEVSGKEQSPELVDA